MSPGEVHPLPAGAGGEQHAVSRFLKLPDGGAAVAPHLEQGKSQPVFHLAVYCPHELVGGEQHQGVAVGGFYQ